MYSAVHGPIPGSASSRRRASHTVCACVYDELIARERCHEGKQTAPAGNGHREPRDVRAGQRLHGGKHVRHRAERALELLAVIGNQPARERTGASHGDLLAEHGADGQLVAVDGAGHAPSRRIAHERSEQRV